MQHLPWEVAPCSVHLCRLFDPDPTFPDRSHTTEHAGKPSFSSLLTPPHLPSHSLLATFSLSELHCCCRGGKKSQPWGRTIIDRLTEQVRQWDTVYPCCLLLAMRSEGLTMTMVVVMMMSEQEGSESLVSKLCVDGKSHNWVPVKRCADWFVKTSVWSLSLRIPWNKYLYAFLYFCVASCVCACGCYFIRAPWNLNHAAAPQQSALVLFSRGGSVASSPWGQLKKTKPPPKCSLSINHPFYYELIRSIRLLFVCCTFKQCKPPEPPQDSKVSHTLQQGNHEAIKNNQINARYSIPGIRREFLYYFTVVSV